MHLDKSLALKTARNPIQLGQISAMLRAEPRQSDQNEQWREYVKGFIGAEYFIILRIEDHFSEHITYCEEDIVEEYVEDK